MKSRSASRLLVSLAFASTFGLAACEGGSSKWIAPPFSAAGIPIDAEFDESASAIVGGSTQPGEPAVVVLAEKGTNAEGEVEYGPFCSGTLIGKNTVLTAAHCFEDATPEMEFVVGFGPRTNAINRLVSVQQFVNHSSYQGITGDGHDVTVLRLQSSVTNVVPYQINDTALSNADVNRAVRHVGFGNSNGGGPSPSNPATGFGIKREATFPIRSVHQWEYESGASGTQTCSGDSGGPGFMVTAGNSLPRVIGTVSYGDEFCKHTGYDTRVDTVASWVRSTASWETFGTCAQDNTCVPGCSPTSDPDCTSCAADNVCNNNCTNDPDCTEFGAACVSAGACRGSQCVTDPQHDEAYCSQSCSTENACPTGFACSNSVCVHEQLPEADLGETCDAATFCSEDTVCAGSSASATKCERPCSTSLLCGSGFSCVTGVNNVSFCRSTSGSAIVNAGSNSGASGANTNVDGNGSTSSQTSKYADDSSGCSAGAAGLPSGLMLLASALLRRRRA